MVVHTPEGVELQLLLAGAASRFIAGVLDLCVQGVLIVLFAVLLGVLGGPGGGLLVALFIVVEFIIFYGYNVFFEVLAAGRTPGKRLNHLRVVDDRGGPVHLRASAIRNLVRVLEAAFFYLPTLLSILISARNQRLGDIAAGTLVVRDGARESSRRSKRRRISRKRRRADSTQASDRSPLSAGHAWDVSAITREELSVVRRYLERREGLDPRARHELATRLAQGLGAKVAGAPEGQDPELFLEALADTKSER